MYRAIQAVLLVFMAVAIMAVGWFSNDLWQQHRDANAPQEKPAAWTTPVKPAGPMNLPGHPDIQINVI